uniref:Uncharacterized protein n=1 Tax=Triticum urartu TaxID=4572 RepID=A0A8R7RDU2_TRIUA
GLVKTQEGLVKIPRTRSTSPHRDTPPTPPSSAATSPVPAVQFRSAAPPSRRAPPTSPSSATPLAVERHPNSPVTSRSASLAGDFQIRLPPRAEWLIIIYSDQKRVGKEEWPMAATKMNTCKFMKLEVCKCG